MQSWAADGAVPRGSQVRARSWLGGVTALCGPLEPGKLKEGPRKCSPTHNSTPPNRFAKSLLAVSDDALIDTYQQALDDHRAARAEGSDNLTKAYAQTLATEKAMRDRFPDYRTRYTVRYP